MINFLDFVADNIIDENHDFQNIKIILPSNRASLFLRNKLIQKIKKPVISPEIISISEFISELSGINRVENTSVVFELYLIYSKIILKKNQQNFDEFMGWAPVLINDFNLMDSYLVDSKALFSSMVSAQEIKEWAQLDNSDSSTIKNSDFWKNIPALYSSLNNKFIKDGVGTSGMQFREAIKHLELYLSQNKKFHYFIGFNMLNTAESNIIQEFISQKKGKVFWDLDKEFYNDKKHSAGKFIRSYYKEWKCLRNKNPEGLSSNFKKDKVFNVIETSNKISQAKYVGQIINDWKPSDVISKKGIILGDDKILPAVLSGINLDTSHWNVTMGLAINNSSSVSILDMIFEMHINTIEGNYFYEDVFSILNDSIVKNKFKKEKINFNKLINDLEESNYTYFPIQKLYSNKTSFQYIVFRPVASSSDLLQKLQFLIKHLEEGNHFIKQEGSFNLEEFNIIKKVITKLLNYADQIKNIPLKVLFLLYKEAIKEQKLNFSGDSSSDIQIMSLPETRLIDFDSVIITNVNEGVLPKGKSNDSFFPFDVKKHFQLPTFLEQDAKYAYQFYRLIQNASNVYLLYSLSDKGLGGSEKSRFIYQLEHFKKSNHQLNLMKVKSSFKNNSQFKVDKSKEVIEILKSIVKKGLSPSAITSFMINPLQFYYQRVLKIRELGKLFPVIEPRDKGNVVHETLEAIYKPFVSKELVVRNYDSMIKKLPVVLDEKYKLIYGGNPERKGHNYLIYEELKKQCEEFLLTERLLIEKGNKLKILSLEKKIEYDLDFKELLFPVKIIGTIDRVDEWNGKLRISDYKTGSVKKNKLKFSSNFTFEGLESQKSLENSSLFQLLLYSYVYSKQNSHEGIKTGIIPIKTPKDYFYPVTISSDKENKDLLLINTFNQFEKELIAVIKKLFNENIAFIANDSE
tara:strand:- start:334 stop:3072 length:2739 start_codon:yes stop_codon:yes gene_type:complete